MAFKFNINGVDFIVIATEKRGYEYWDCVKNVKTGTFKWVESDSLKKYGRDIWSYKKK